MQTIIMPYFIVQRLHSICHWDLIQQNPPSRL